MLCTRSARHTQSWAKHIFEVPGLNSAITKLFDVCLFSRAAFIYTTRIASDLIKHNIQTPCVGWQVAVELEDPDAAFLLAIMHKAGRGGLATDDTAAAKLEQTACVGLCIAWQARCLLSNLWNTSAQLSQGFTWTFASFEELGATV